MEGPLSAVITIDREMAAEINAVNKTKILTRFIAPKGIHIYPVSSPTEMTYTPEDGQQVPIALSNKQNLWATRTTSARGKLPLVYTTTPKPMECRGRKPRNAREELLTVVLCSPPAVPPTTLGPWT